MNYKFIDREQKLQLKRAERYGYVWAQKHRGELAAMDGRPEVYHFLVGHDNFMAGLPRAFGWDRIAKMLQGGRIFHAAMGGVLRSLARMGVEILPY